MNLPLPLECLNTRQWPVFNDKAFLIGATSRLDDNSALWIAYDDRRGAPAI
jgi:hypothetical protein